MRYTDNLATRLYFEDRGSGPALLLVHGHPFDHTMWQPQIDRFSLTHRVIAPDLRGYGITPLGATALTEVTGLGDFAEDLVDLLDDLGIEQAVVAGLSMGGQIAMELHRRHPERVRGLVLADTFPAAETEEGKAARNAMADRLLKEGMQGYADEVLDRMVAPYNTHAAPHVHRMMCASDPVGAAAALRGRAERPDYRESLTTVAVPALVVVGRDDTYTPVEDAEEMHALLPDSTLAVIERAAHLPNLEQPEEFDAVLDSYLRSLVRLS
ncbi:Beta-ketoadipate enol-lactone hydrolase [Streptomyces venezuelae]|uniref:alpha/beta fold hydrolase n=1 Tax=Streptomyces gardneri TaxID=66892 RepID=UPI0006BC7670|nr:alpha/beta fold hydrolase [Streptomyces gardneri]ALO09546.1 Beta-ketoadipate enol-lactone hydrolase [Streptomyces venezuelae]QPK46638.1 alpha/beta fold hydrolase [Streptomyces gardneri]WRK38031.1 alpha/beta fold hydrolase [Streptomyces venezuelae]CUM40030.1 Alpha/beta hydrolase fold [Streptomyces venezuelae]